MFALLREKSLRSFNEGRIFVGGYFLFEAWRNDTEEGAMEHLGTLYNKKDEKGVIQGVVSEKSYEQSNNCFL